MKYNEEMTQRKKLFNEVQEAKGMFSAHVMSTNYFQFVDFIHNYFLGIIAQRLCYK